MYDKISKAFGYYEVIHPDSKDNYQFVPSFGGKIENEPNRSDNRSKAASEVDLLKDCNQKQWKKNPKIQKIRSKKNIMFIYDIR